MRDLLTKLARRKCPHCKEYGISAGSGIGRNTTHTCTCSYCNKSFRVNSALAFLVKIGWCLGTAIPALIIRTYVVPFSDLAVALVVIAIVAGYFTIGRFIPMKEEKE